MPAHDAGHSLARTTAALIGAPAAALALGLALAAALPLDRPLAHAIGAHAIVPLWVVLATVLPLARSGGRAWALCASIALPSLAVLAAR